MKLVLENIGLSVGATPLITDVSLTLEQGTMNVLLGPTLAGKTTLMRLMAGLDRPTTGRLLADGQDVTGVLAAARVFSDPPLNELAVEKHGAMLTLENGRQIPANEAFAGLPDGGYRLGFRADAVAISAMQSGALSFPGTVSVTEISGSESFVHVDVGLGVWVCLVTGIHDWLPGATVNVQLDASRVFDADGRLAATAPGIAATA